jgi:hypothetical protein
MINHRNVTNRAFPGALGKRTEDKDLAPAVGKFIACGDCL